jgi:hypothetical protein
MIWKYVFCGASDYEALLEEAIDNMPTVEVFLDDKLEPVHAEGEEPSQEEFERIDRHLTRMGYDEDMVYITRHQYE